MPLNNSQYDEIRREYDAIQLKNRHILEERKQKAYQEAPELKELEAAIAELSVSSARKLIDGDPDILASYKKELKALRTRRTQLLTDLGYPQNYFDPVYQCQDCKDTGYINNSRCHCMKQRMIDLVYTQSNVKNILAEENFENFCFDYYSASKKNEVTGLTSLQTAQAAFQTCQGFIADFDKKFSNLLFCGDTGTGKTFFSNCVAKELLDKGYSVIYFTAFELFDILGKGLFDKSNQVSLSQNHILDCDLLIIDDLGTELTNTFTTSQLFLCLNERILRKKSTIISTNLNMRQIADTYSERISSRVLSNYTLIKLFGDDIRMKKRMS